MKKIITSLLTALMVSVGVQAENIQPILEDFHYGDTLFAMIVGEEDCGIDEGTKWAIDVSDEGNVVKVSVYCDAGYSLYDEELEDVTTSAIYDEEGGELMGFMITEDANEGRSIIGFVLEEGNWIMIIEE